MAKQKKAKRVYLEGQIPLVDISGSPFECGVNLGRTWSDALAQIAQGFGEITTPWWMDKTFSKLVDQYAPHLPDLFQGMAKGSGLPEKKIVGLSPSSKVKQEECTSFALHPKATLDGKLGKEILL